MPARPPVEPPYDRVPRDRQCIDVDVGQMTDLAAPEATESTFVEAVSDLLSGAGLDLLQADVLAEQVNDLAEKFFAASEAASNARPGAIIAAKLEAAPLARTVAGRAYIRVLQGTQKPSLSADSDALGVSKVALWKAEKATRQAIVG